MKRSVRLNPTPLRSSFPCFHQLVTLSSSEQQCLHGISPVFFTPECPEAGGVGLGPALSQETLSS